MDVSLALLKRWAPAVARDPHRVERIGRYEIRSRLAIGGMAEILLARSIGLANIEKQVVIKRILRQHANNRAFVKMFLDEARIAATLDHPNVVHVFDVGTEGSSYFLVMEYLRGRDLRFILRALAERQERLPLPFALQIVSVVSSGLHHAHEKTDAQGRPMNIVHRDVSPSNVLVTFEGAIKLLDFGIATARARLAETSTGSWKGKVRYASPEQCRLGRVDRRSDVFSLGVMLWELTTGRSPWPVADDYQLLQVVAGTDAPPPSAFVDGYPPDLERIVVRALQRQTEERFQSAEELHLELEAFIRRHGMARPPSELGRFLRGLFGDPGDVPEVEDDPLTAVTGSQFDLRSRPRSLRWLASVSAALALVFLITMLLQKSHEPADATKTRLVQANAREAAMDDTGPPPPFHAPAPPEANSSSVIGPGAGIASTSTRVAPRPKKRAPERVGKRKLRRRLPTTLSARSEQPLPDTSPLPP